MTLQFHHELFHPRTSDIWTDDSIGDPKDVGLCDLSLAGERIANWQLNFILSSDIGDIDTKFYFLFGRLIDGEEVHKKLSRKNLRPRSPLAIIWEVA